MQITLGRPIVTFLGDLFAKKPYVLEHPIVNAIPNLECVIAEDRDPAKGKILLRSEHLYLRTIFGSGVVAVNLANNHAFDYGRRGLERTMEHLRSQSIAYFGAGCESDGYHNPLLLAMPGNRTLAVLGYCSTTSNPAPNDGEWGVASLERGKPSEQLASIRNRVDGIVVVVHWGDEEIPVPSGHQVDSSKALIDAGADVVIGHHAHVAQPYMIYRGKPVFFGLGNFIFPELDEASYWDGESYTMRYRKVLRTQHRHSLVVEIGSDLHVSAVHRASVEGNRVRLSPCEMKDVGPKVMANAWVRGYARARRRYLRWYLLTNMIRQPRLPTIKSVKRFFAGSF